MMREAIVWLLVGCLLAFVGIRWGWRSWQRHKRRAISRRAKVGESEAEKLLKQHGYVVVDTQVRRPVTMTVDGERIESHIQIDYLAAKGSKEYLVEVKTGKQANVRLPHVRRQLFEYQNIFQTDGILFIDMNKYDIMEVSFDEPHRTSTGVKPFIGGLLLGVCLMVFIYSYH